MTFIPYESLADFETKEKVDVRELRFDFQNV